MNDNADEDLILDETDGQQTNAQRDLGMPLIEARRALGSCLDNFMTQALQWHELPTDGRPKPDHAAIRITTGAGKSEQLRRMIAKFIPEAKRRGVPHRVLYLVPTHTLANEARGRMQDGVTAALWQGRQGKDQKSGETICRNLDAVHAAIKIGADVEETACRKGRRGGEAIKCTFYETCGYQAQKPKAAAADVVFAAHEIGFRTPKAIGGNFGLVVIDEAFWQDGLSDLKIAPAGLGYELQNFPVRDFKGVPLGDDTAHLKELIERLQNALSASPDGYVTKAALRNAGFLPTTVCEDGSCRVAKKLEWARKVDVAIFPDTSAETRRTKADRFQFLGQLRRRAAMWDALHELVSGVSEATGRLKLETRTTPEGSVRWLYVLGRQDIDETLAELPLIHADATMYLSIVQHYLPRVTMHLNIDVEAPYEHVTQVIDLPVGKSSLQALAPGKRWEGEEQRVSRKRQRLADVVRHKTQGRRALVITYADVEADFRQIEGVEVGHWNAIEGIDRWGDVDVLVTIGRPLPSPNAIEKMAASLTGKPIEIEETETVVRGRTVKQKMIERGRGIRLKSGADHVLKCRMYDNPDAEMIREAVVEAALVQAVGRARGVNRTATSAVEVFVICHDSVMPGLVDAVVEFSDIEPSAIDEMMTRGIIPAFPGDAAKLYSDLFPTRAAAKMAYHRARLSVEGGTMSVTSPYREVPIRACYRDRVRYQPQGRGQQPRIALVDPDKVTDAKAMLEAALGPLVSFELLVEANSQAASEAPLQPAMPTEAPRVYQLDLFGAAVIDLNAYRAEYQQGPLPPDLAVAVRAEYRARDISQAKAAADIGLSQGQFCNALKGRFGLSAAAAERLISWMAEA